MESADALVEEKKLMNEAKYRNYMSNIDKALKNFEYSSEWADLISALGKLCKAISSNTQYQIIPRRIKISKRLSQCMHPALPSGVHLKALETYDVIFSKTGSERLATELFIYSAGLFPLLGYAAMNVRPALLQIYEKYFVPLGEKLRPALSGFLTGVLPGYEAGLDHFDRTSSLLTQICNAVNPIYFYTVFWESVATNAAIRLPAISFLVDHFNKKVGMKEQTYIMGHNHDVMMSGLCACLNDSVILVQRNTLEFLLLGFPMHTPYLTEKDLIKLITNSLNTILRRDMSLNRRLYSWLLGTEIKKIEQQYSSADDSLLDESKTETYFEKHSKHILIKALVWTLKFSLETDPIDLKPYRIMVSLLDKAEIGPPVLDYVLCDIVRTMSLSSGNSEVTKAANLLFATFDPAYIWNFMTNTFEKTCKFNKPNWDTLSGTLRYLEQSTEKISKFESLVGSGDPCLIEICYLMEFLLETISLEMYNETTRIYLPKVFLSITQLLTIYTDHFTNEEVTASLHLCMKIVSRVQPIISSPVKLNSKHSNMDEDFLKSNQNNLNSLHNNVISDTISSGGSNALEKSKSDSKLNQIAHNEVEDNDDNEPIRRSNSNHFIDRHKNNQSPKKQANINRNTNSKKAKSYSKLLELDKEICPDTGQLIMPSSSSDLDTPQSIKKLKLKKHSPKLLKTSPKKLRPKELKIGNAKKFENALDDDLSHLLDTPLSEQTKQNELDEMKIKSQVQAEPRSPTSQEYSLLEKCIRQYEIFYEIYLSRKLLQITSNSRISNCSVTVKIENENDINENKINSIFDNETVMNNGNVERVQEIDKLFETLKINEICRLTQLRSLLNRSINNVESTSDISDVEFKDCISSTEKLDAADNNKLKIFDDHTEKSIIKLMNLKLSDSLRCSIKLASNLLVEMSTFPNCNKNLVIDKTEIELSPWLKVLSLVTCYIKSDKELQLTAITTLFDLISLLRSQIEHITSPGVTFVVMIPVMKFGNVSYIESKTRVFQLITSVLWNYLGELNTDPMQICSLLYQLHNCLESGLVETVVCTRMLNINQEQYLNNLTDGTQIKRFKSKEHISILTNYKLEKINEMKLMCVSPTASSLELIESESKSFKKFELLWHLGRDKKPQKGFDKTLLKILDTLEFPIYTSNRTFVTKWLQESLLRGDLQRLIKPLNKLLFSSKTKRISIVHVHLIKNQYDDMDALHIDEDSDQKIDNGVYAISSEYGNVKYHIEQHKQKRSPIRSLQKKFFGVTIGNKNKTSNFVSDTKLNTPMNDGDTNISLIINPLESDFEGIEAASAISSSAPNKIETTKNSPTSVKKYFSSSEESDVESSISDSRETSVEKEIFTAGTLIKRFSGDCERVSEALSEHDRTKNRKTYHLNSLTLQKIIDDSNKNQEKPNNMPDMNENHFSDYATTADMAEEYFSSSVENEQVENFLNNLLDKVCETVDKEFQNDSKSEKESNKSISSFNSDSKRASCISKNSTDSNNSNYVAQHNQKPSDSYSDDTEVFSESEIESKRQSLDSQTTKIAEWKLTEKTMEKGKQNVEILRKNVAEAAAGNKKFLRRKISEERKKHYDKLHPFHTHMLLYFGAYDTQQALYAFQTLRNVIASDTRTFLCLSITTSISSNTLKQLLVRHRKSIFGKGFTGNITNTEFSQAYRGCMHLEVLFTCCLYYARSFFYKDLNEQGSDIPQQNDIVGNCKVQLEAVELLTLICTELIDIVKGMGKGLACYIADLMAKCKLQKIILHCLNSSVLVFSMKSQQKQSLSEQILNYNYPNDDNLHSESIQVQLLRLLMAIVKLEHEVMILKNDENNKNTDSNANINTNSPTRFSPNTIINVKYLPNSPISQQPMFLAAVLSALQCENLRHLHRNWTDLVTSSLNCFNFGSLTNIVISVVHQICNNIDKISKVSLKEHFNFPSDYIVSQLEAITILCHYCLLDNTQQTTLSHLFNQAYPQTSVSVQSSNTGQLLNNIVHSFLQSSTGNHDQQPRNTQQAARNAVLSHLPRIVASVAAIWDSELVQIRQIKQQLMEFLSPVSLHHGVNFLAAVAVTWQERGENNKNDKKKLSISEQYLKNSQPEASPDQLSLVSLVSSIRVMPMESFVSTLHQVVKSPPPIHRPPAGLTLEVSALELFYFYLKSAPAPQLGDSWSSLLALLRDGFNLSPPAQFVLLMLLNEFVQRCPNLPFQDKKDIRDLHDITARLVEALSQIAGAGLEQTTWLRRNLAVKQDISPITPDGNAKDISGNQQHYVQAQCVLAVILANLLDVAYGSQEKDKVVNIIITLMYNITPYLKNHTTRNIPSFYACSSLLASLSGYQYTRKAWRKDMLDLLLDNSFFQMDISCFPFWKQIMDSLMTYDNTTFRELMSRVSLTQTGGLNLFTSREQEYEQRALLLKRLAFVLFCSEMDQYHKYMPEIQEQLVNSLRLPSVVPSVQAAVFLCFRVLLIRMTSDNVTSLWPIIIAEMVQVFLAIEQELKSDSEELSQQIRLLSGMDVPWAMSSNGINSQNHLIHWRAVQLEASKLLELGCILPATNLPHFQMYRWAFVGTEFDAPEEKILPNGDLDLTDSLQSSSGIYVPHVRRIARLMDLKYAVHSPTLEFKRGNHVLLTCQQITTLQDLYSFFSTLSVTCLSPHNFADTAKEVSCCLIEIEEVLSKDFLEKMPTNITTR